MSLKVFLSFSVDPDEQAIIWRLQTLAAAHGILLYVPSSQIARERQTNIVPLRVRKAIDDVDCVLAILTQRTTRAVQAELDYAVDKQKLVIALVENSVSLPLGVANKIRVLRFSQSEPDGRVESEVLAFLKNHQMEKQNRQALGAVIAVGLGLLLLSAVTQE